MPFIDFIISNLFWAKVAQFKAISFAEMEFLCAKFCKFAKAINLFCI